MFLKKGMKVKICVGKDKGKTGEIIEINRESILDLFYDSETYSYVPKEKKWKIAFNPKNIKTGKRNI